MKNRIKKLFETKNKNILSIYFTAGYPELNCTAGIIDKLEKNGVDLIEIGLPYSDPLADGPTIQESSSIALKNGMKPDLLFEQISEARKNCTIPIIIMSYYNQILQYGFKDFCKKCKIAEVDGLIIPDLPPELLSNKQAGTLNKYNLGISFLVTNRSLDERIYLADKLSNTFLYLVSTPSITGSRFNVEQETINYFQRIKNMNLNNPLIVGFGISDKETFDETCKYVNGCIIGSAFIRSIKDPDNIYSSITQFIKSIKE